MTELELTVEELEAMDIRAVMSIEISDIWLEMLAADENQDRERMAAAHCKVGAPRSCNWHGPGRVRTRSYLAGIPQGASVTNS